MPQISLADHTSPEGERETTDCLKVGDPADIFNIRGSASCSGTIVFSEAALRRDSRHPGISDLAESFANGQKNCKVVQISFGFHYLQEDHPDVIGTTVTKWLTDLGIASSPKQKLNLRTS
jgi:haloalkane dehalogenase